MKKKILLFITAILCGVSLIVCGAISAFAGFFNGTFTVDEVLTDYDQYKSVQTSNFGVVDLSGQYRISVEYGPSVSFEIDSSEPLLLFDAPADFYVYYLDPASGNIGALYDSISIAQDWERGVQYLLLELDGVVQRVDYAIPGDHVFIVPELPDYGFDEQNKVFGRAGSVVTVSKLGDVSPVPPSMSVYDDITSVWSDLWDNVVAWLGDADKYFFTDGSLTALGLCCAVPMGAGVVMLLVHIIMKFLRLRG